MVSLIAPKSPKFIHNHCTDSEEYEHPSHDCNALEDRKVREEVQEAQKFLKRKKKGRKDKNALMTSSSTYYFSCWKKTRGFLARNLRGAIHCDPLQRKGDVI
jgi:hypothetical protein